MTGIAAPDAPLLQVDAITKTFGGFTALDNISVDLQQGRVGRSVICHACLPRAGDSAAATSR